MGESTSKDKLLATMNSITARVQKLSEKYRNLIRLTVEEATERFLSLREKNVDWRTANEEIRKRIIEKMLSDKEWLGVWADLREGEMSPDSLLLVQDGLLQMLPCEVPQTETTGLPAAWRMGVAAALGAIVGANLLAIPSWQPGIVIGGVLGAFVFSFASLRLLEFKAPFPLAGWLDIPIRNGMKKLLAVRVYQTGYQHTVEQYLTLWLRAALIYSAFTIVAYDRKTEAGFSHVNHELIEMLLELKDTPENELPAAAQELAAMAEQRGFALLATEDSFLWDREAALYFDTFGNVSIGDRVKVKRKPLLFEGEVVRKGLVIKDRR